MTRAKRDQKHIQRHQQLCSDWQEIARTPAGRRIIADLMGWGWVFQPIEETDPIQMALCNGERNFALRVARYLTLEPGVFVASMRDNDEAAKEWMGVNDYNEMMAAYFAPAKSGPLNS